jgi:hypothetical protein
MYQVDKKTGQLKRDADGNYLPKTAHSLNPVTAIIYDTANVSGARLADVPDAGIAKLAATCMTLLGFEPPEDYTPSLVDAGKGRLRPARRGRLVILASRAPHVLYLSYPQVNEKWISLMTQDSDFASIFLFDLSPISI